MSQGKELTYEQKQAIVHVKQHMDYEKGQGKSISTANPARRTAQALHVSLATVKSVLADANTIKASCRTQQGNPVGMVYQKSEGMR